MSDKIEKMLRALLANNKQLHYVGGYVRGVTSKGDPYVALYAPNDGMDHKVCKVYPSKFKKLPPFVNVEGNGVRGKHTPTKSDAKDRGVYVECTTFSILTVYGKDTQMGPEIRFFDVLDVFNGGAVRGANGRENGRLSAPPSRVADTGNVNENSFVGDNESCPVAFLPLFRSYVDSEGKRPFSLESLKEWYSRDK